MPATFLRRVTEDQDFILCTFVSRQRSKQWRIQFRSSCPDGALADALPYSRRFRDCLLDASPSRCVESLPSSSIVLLVLWYGW